MGGGSADAAAALRLAAAAAGPRARDDALLHAIAVALGADVPASSRPERCLMTGIGEGVRRLGDPRAVRRCSIVPVARTRCRRRRSTREFDRLGLGRDPDELDRLSGQVPGAARDGVAARRAAAAQRPRGARALAVPADRRRARRRARVGRRCARWSPAPGPTVFGLFPGAEGVAHAQAAAAALRARHPHAVAATPVGRAFAEPRAA